MAKVGTRLYGCYWSSLARTKQVIAAKYTDKLLIHVLPMKTNTQARAHALTHAHKIRYNVKKRLKIFKVLLSSQLFFFHATELKLSTR